MTKKEAVRGAKVSLECLLTGWSGALMSANAASESRTKASVAALKARRALAAGATPYQVVVEHVAPALRTHADDEDES